MLLSSFYYKVGKINRLEIIAKRGIIARLGYNTSFGLNEKIGCGSLLLLVLAVRIYTLV